MIGHYSRGWQVISWLARSFIFMPLSLSLPPLPSCTIHYSRGALTHYRLCADNIVCSSMCVLLSNNTQPLVHAPILGYIPILGYMYIPILGYIPILVYIPFIRVHTLYWGTYSILGYISYIRVRMRLCSQAKLISSRVNNAACSILLQFTQAGFAISTHPTLHTLLNSFHLCSYNWMA